jgi:hypothetical protein
MTRASWTAVALLGLLAGYLLGSIGINHSAQAQSPDHRQARFQVSAYAGQTENGVHHGCYVVDSTTGAVWHVMHGGKAEAVTQKLP